MSGKDWILPVFFALTQQRMQQSILSGLALQLESSTSEKSKKLKNTSRKAFCAIKSRITVTHGMCVWRSGAILTDVRLKRTSQPLAERSTVTIDASVTWYPRVLLSENETSHAKRRTSLVRVRNLMTSLAHVALSQESRDTYDRMSTSCDDRCKKSWIWTLKTNYIISKEYFL